MLNFYFLNVQHGDSIIVEYLNDGHKSYGVVDSNVSGRNTPLALTKLQELGAEQLSFLCITHPHHDHFKGMHNIMQHFKGRIDQLYTFPAGELTVNPKKLKDLAQKLIEQTNSMDDLELTSRKLELLQILQVANDDFGKRGAWLEVCSNMQQVPPGFQGVDIKVLLPPPKAKGDRYIKQITNENTADDADTDINSLSVALQISYAGRKVILGADACEAEWLFHKRIYQRDESIESDVVKLPHHGSKKDCNETTLPMFFDVNGEKVGVISANGRSHPDGEVLQWLLNNQIRPLCTNLSKFWDEGNIEDFINTSGLEGNLKRLVRQYAVDRNDRFQPCKGTIKISIQANGAVTIDTEYNNICGCEVNSGGNLLSVLSTA